MMEKLHTASIYLLRYGGMHPVKTANRISISLGLLLWTVVLQMMLQLANGYYIMSHLSPKITSLNGFLFYVWDITFVFSSIFIPIHFFCHANKIVTVNSKLDEIIKICSISSLKMSIESKVRIFLLILMRIIITFLIVFMAIIGDDNDYIHIFVQFNIAVINTIAYQIFAIYLTILTEYFKIDETRIADYFDRMRSSINHISVATMEYFDDTQTNPLGVDTSNHAQQSLYRQYSINAIKALPRPTSRPYHDSTSSQLFMRTLQTPDKAVYTQTHDLDDNMQDFFQKLDRIHDSIFEIHNIYNLCKSILGFPILYLTICDTIDLCAGTYAIYLIKDMSCCSFIPMALFQIATLLNAALLTTFPRNLDQKASNSDVIYSYSYLENADSAQIDIENIIILQHLKCIFLTRLGKRFIIPIMFYFNSVF